MQICCRRLDIYIHYSHFNFLKLKWEINVPLLRLVDEFCILNDNIILILATVETMVALNKYWESIMNTVACASEKVIYPVIINCN